jgi:hypothetical protein
MNSRMIELSKQIRNPNVKNKRTTISIQQEKKLELERAAIEISYKTGKSVSWTDVAHYMLNNYIKLAKEDIKEESK